MKQYNDAQRYFQESLELSQAMGDRRNIAIALNNLADVAVLQQQVDAAKPMLHDGLVAAHDMKVQPIVIHGLVIYAKLLAAASQVERAANLLHFASSHPATLNETRSKHITPALAKLRADHSDSIIDAALDKASVLDYDTLVAEAVADLSVSGEI